MRVPAGHTGEGGAWSQFSHRNNSRLSKCINKMFYVCLREGRRRSRSARAAHLPPGNENNCGFRCVNRDDSIVCETFLNKNTVCNT